MIEREGGGEPGGRSPLAASISLVAVRRGRFPPARRRPTLVPEKSVQYGRPRHIAGSVWWPAPSPALDHQGSRIQPGTAPAGEGAGHHTEPAMSTLISRELYLAL